MRHAGAVNPTTENNLRISEKWLAARPKSVVHIRRPVPLEGRFAIVTSAGRDAMDAGGASDEGISRGRKKACGPDTPTLVSSSRRATFVGDGGQRARAPGRARTNPLKPLRGECRVIPVGPWYARMLFSLAYEPAGASSV